MSANTPRPLPIGIPLINQTVNMIKFRMTRGEVEIIQFRLIEETRPHFMKTAMKVSLNKTPQLIQRCKRPRVKLYPLLSPCIIAGRTANTLRNLVPRSNPSPVITPCIMPAVDTVNIIPMKTQESLAVSWRRHRSRHQMIRMMPNSMLI